MKAYRAEVLELEKKTPYGVPYEPNIWGAGWGIQGFGMEQYFLHTAFPDVFPKDAMLHALELRPRLPPGPEQRVVRLGRRLASRSPSATASTAPTGATSRAAASRAPPSSGRTIPELLEWPYLWQQTEYVLGGGTTDYLFLVLAADHLLNRN